MKFYGKKTCITCKNAKAFLEAKKVSFDELEIEKTPPAKSILEQLLTTYENAGNLKAAVNTRSSAYKALSGKPLPSKEKLLALMLKDPNLIKRPILLKDNGQALMGFDEAETKAFLK